MNLVLCAAALASALAAQQVRIVAPVAGAVVPQNAGAQSDDDVGVNVEMFENPNLDRYLHKAQDFLATEEYEKAIKVLQDVIDGRTSIVVDKPKEEPGAQAEPPTPRKPEPQEAPGAISVQKLGPGQAVFSPDGRVYRPVRRLCQELLATMPPSGLSLYQTSYEVAAGELLELAIAGNDSVALEAVANRYFITLAAGRAMALLADRLMYDGRYRAAVQVLHDLVDVYPASNRVKLGIHETWCRYKIALCLRMAGEVQVAHEAAADLAQRFPDESLRIAGELQPLSGLAATPQFALAAGGGSELEVGSHALAAAKACSWLRPGLERLVPLWRADFTDPQPYKQTPRRNDNSGIRFVQGQVVSNCAPYAYRYGTGTRVVFRGDGAVADRALFLDHNRLTVAAAFSGLLVAEGDGRNDAPKPKDNQARARVPVYDWANMRVIEDAQRYYAIQVYEGSSTATINPLKENSLCAYDKATLQPVWSSANWQEGEDGLADTTFLAAVTVYGERLLVPVLRRNAYEMLCLDRQSGRPLWRVPVHMGGTPFFKAPGTPIQVVGGTAYMLTNAGALAAVDAFAGELRWLRRYDRRHPLREAPRVRAGSNRNQNPFGNQVMNFTEAELPSFLPSEMVCRDGLVVIAPCDSFVLTCLDGASGQVVWLLDQSCSYADFGSMQYVVGANADNLYVATRTDLVCIGLHSGLRLWSRSLPSSNDDWRGRGLVLDDVVLLPNGREVLAYAADGRSEPQRIDLPPFAVGPEPPAGAANLTVAGPWLGVAYEGAVEVYSSVPVLRELADACDDPLQRSSYLVQAGDVDAAIDTLDRWLLAAQLPAPERARATTRMLEIARERAMALAGSDLAAALQLLDRVRAHIVDRRVRMDWHVTRLDLYKEARDLVAYEAEQQRLYRFMEGKD